MIVMLTPGCPDEQVQQLVKLLADMHADCCVIDAAPRTLVEVLGTSSGVDRDRLARAPMVERIIDHAEPSLAADREAGEETRAIPIGGGRAIGGRAIGVIAGPCAVETEDQLLRIAEAVADAGAVALRGGAFKPRTSPYSFQGLGERGLEMLARAREKTGLSVVTEVMSPQQVDLVAQYADLLQIGSRNMHSTSLLVAVGQQSKPVLVKRGWSATLEEFLMAAEYVMKEGNHDVILCERGIRTHEVYVRNTLALAAVPEVKRLSRLPIIVDPSHGTGRRHLVAPMSRGAIACGADGLLIEVHHSPDQAWCDGDQSLPLQDFRQLMGGLRTLAAAGDRELPDGASVPSRVAAVAPTC